MFCQYCGKEIAEAASVCIGCGRGVQSLREATIGPVEATGKFSEGAMTGLVIASVLIPILGVVLGIVFLNSDSSSLERKKQAKIILIVALSVWAVFGLLLLAGD